LNRENIFEKRLAIIKRVCIFAPSFSEADIIEYYYKDFKDTEQ